MIWTLDPSSYKQIVDLQDVTFLSLSDSKVLCSGAKPSTECLPEKLLLLKSKVSSCYQVRLDEVAEKEIFVHAICIRKILHLCVFFFPGRPFLCLTKVKVTVFPMFGFLVCRTLDGKDGEKSLMVVMDQYSELKLPSFWYTITYHTFGFSQSNSLQ